MVEEALSNFRFNLAQSKINSKTNVTKGNTYNITDINKQYLFL